MLICSYTRSRSLYYAVYDIDLIGGELSSTNDSKSYNGNYDGNAINHLLHDAYKSTPFLSRFNYNQFNIKSCNCNCNRTTQCTVFSKRSLSRACSQRQPWPGTSRAMSGRSTTPSGPAGLAPMFSRVDFIVKRVTLKVLSLSPSAFE